MVTPFAVLNGPFPKLGVIALAGLVAIAVLARQPRTRAVGMLGALGLSPVLLLVDIWHSPQLHSIHRHPLIVVAIGAAAALALGVVAALLVRRPALLAPLTILTLPFRIPIQAGGTTSNLLVPLYFVVAAGALGEIVRAFRSADADEQRPGWIARVLVLYVLVYAAQSTYSSDFEKALQQMAFFYAPFALLFGLLRMLEWTPRLIRICLQLLVALAVVFAVVGFAEFATKTVFLNPKLIAENDLHAYFTVNSVFFDPDIFGRFLALVMTLVAAVLLYGRRRREQFGATLLLAVLWAGLVLTLSRSSLGALLVGLGSLAAMRWRALPVIVTGVAVVALGVAVIAVTPKTFGLNQGLNGASSGRAGLISGGIHLFGDRPIWGYGSASFSKVYKQRHPATAQNLSASHTIPVTIAAEQGVIGELAYVALVLVAALTLIRGARADPARAAVASAFLALVFHTMLYADFLEDPVTWTLLGLGAALAVRPPGQAPQREPEPALVAA